MRLERLGSQHGHKNANSGSENRASQHLLSTSIFCPLKHPLLSSDQLTDDQLLNQTPRIQTQARREQRHFWFLLTGRLEQRVLPEDIKSQGEKTSKEEKLWDLVLLHKTWGKNEYLCLHTASASGQISTTSSS